MELVESFLTKNPCYRAGRKIVVKGLMLHSVGCAQPSAEVFVRNWDSPTQMRACVHAFIDGGTGKVYQTLPWSRRGWHCGGSANNTHIGVEMCEPSCIRYQGAGSFTCSDTQAALAVVKRTYHTAVELFALLCRKFQLNPLTPGVIVSHREGHARGIASGHGDPEHLWKGLGAPYTMERFRKDVSAAMEAADPKKPPHPKQMKLSGRGLEFIADCEGCRLKAYKCPAGVWTIGYGHTAGVKEGDELPSKEAAKELLAKDLEQFAAYVNACVSEKRIRFRLNQNQFDALTSFCYNCGRGNLQRLVTGRSAATVADKMLLYVRGGGKVLPGLKERRIKERKLFLEKAKTHGE